MRLALVDAWLDHNIGLIMDALDASGQTENTDDLYLRSWG